MNSTLKICKIGPPREAKFWSNRTKRHWYFTVFGFVPSTYKQLVKITSEQITTEGKKYLGMEIPR